MSGKFNNGIKVPFGEKGLREPIPETSDKGLLNQEEGFTELYKKPINDGGAYIEMENFNEIIHGTQAAVKEIQDKCVTSVEGSLPDEKGNVQVPHATEIFSGIVRIATDNDIESGSSDECVVTPKKIANLKLVRSVNGNIPDKEGKLEIPKATEEVAGVISLTTTEEIQKGIDNIDAITPYVLKEAGFRPGSGTFIGSLVSSALDRGQSFEENGGWWLKCDNTSYRKQDFPILSKIIGDTWGNSYNDWQPTSKTDGVWYSVSSLSNGDVLACSMKNQGIWISHDGGDTWVASGISDGDWGHTLQLSDGSILAPSLSGRGIWVSNDNGQTWKQTGKTDESWEVFLECPNHTILVGSATNFGIWCSTDNGQTWAPTGQTQFRWLTFCLIGNNKDILAGSFGAGICVSNDNGATWSQTYNRDGIFADIYMLNNGTLVAGGFNLSGTGGIWSSYNNGLNWNLVNGECNGYGFIQLKDETILVVTNLGIFKSSDFGRLWHKTSFNGDLHSITLLSNNNIVIGGVYNDGISISKVNNDEFRVPDFTNRAAIGAGGDFAFGSMIEDTMQKMTGYIYSLIQAFPELRDLFGVFKRLASAPLNTPCIAGSSSWAFDLQFDNALVACTADHTQTRGVSVYYYVFAGDKATSPAPSNFVATNVSATEVNLTWQAPTSGVIPVSYNVYASSSFFSGYVKKANVTDLTWSDTDIPTTSAMRYYQVSAVSGDGTESSLSDYVSAFFLVAPAVEMRAKDVLITMAGVNIPNTFLSIQQSINGTDWTTVREPADIQTPLSLNAGTYYFRYRYYVGSIDGGYGAATGAIVIGAPDAPILSINSQTKTLSWTNPNNSGLSFVLYRNGNAIVETTGLTYTVNDMVPGDEYYIESLRVDIATPSNHAYDLIPGIYAGTMNGIYKSVDGGNNWILM